MSNGNVEQGRLVIGRTQFSDGELLPDQKKAVNRIIDLVQKIKVKEGDPCQSKLGKYFTNSDNSTHVFSIMGDRGQGKTATLFASCSRLDKLEGKKCLVVPILEPELINNNIGLFPAIISNIYRVLKEKNECRIPTESANLEKELVDLMKDFIAQSGIGLNLVAELSGTVEGLAKRMMCYGSDKLSGARQFHCWIEKFLKMMGYELLVFPVDDVDLCKDMGQDVLEAIRIYLSHPKIVVILTADYSTLLRTVRNHNLHNLPRFFTSSQVALPVQENERDEEDEEDAFKEAVGSSRSQLLAEEYNAENKYANHSLNKVVPPGYRSYLRGIPGEERMKTEFNFSSVNHEQKDGSKITIFHLLGRIVLLRDIADNYEEQFKPDTGITIEKILGELLDKKEADKKDKSNWMLRIFGERFDVFSPSLRILLNQVQELNFMVIEWRKDLECIRNGKELDNSKLRFENFEFMKGDQNIELLGHLLNPDKSTDKIIKNIKMVEEYYLMRFIYVLAIHPEIQTDRELFRSFRSQSNALDANNISQFLRYNDRTMSRGRILRKFSFKTKSERFSNASSEMLNIVAEYGASVNYNPWWMAKKLDILIVFSFNVTIKMLYPFEILYIRTFKPSDNTAAEKIAESVINNIQYINIRSKIYDDKFTICYFDDVINFPSMLWTFYEMRTYRISGINAKFRNEIINEIKKIETSPKRIIVIVINELENACRFLGISCRVMLKEIDGLVSALLKGERGNFDYTVESIDRKFWVVTKIKGFGEILIKLLKNREKEYPLRNMLTLLHLASLPLAPLLIVCPPTELNASEILAHIRLVISEFNAYSVDGKLQLNINEYVNNESDCEEKRIIEIRNGNELPDRMKLILQDSPGDIDTKIDRLDAFVRLVCYLKDDKTERGPEEYANNKNPPGTWQQLISTLASTRKSSGDA